MNIEEIMTVLIDGTCKKKVWIIKSKCIKMTVLLFKF